MAKKVKVPRKTLAEKLDVAREQGRARGYVEGRAAAQLWPNGNYKDALVDFVRAIDSWPIQGSDVVALIGTDLKHICNLAIPARTAKAIATELKRLGYAP